MSREITARQLCALSFCAFTLPAVVLLPRAGWLWATLAAIAVALLLYILLRLRRRCCADMATLAAQTAPGKAALILTLLWNYAALGLGARLICSLYPQGSEVLGLLLLLLAAYAAGCGSAVPLRVGAVCFFFVLGFFAILLGFSLPQMQVRNLAPQTRAPWLLLPVILLPTCALYGETGAGKVGGWLVCGVVLASLVALVTAGTLSPQVAGREFFPFYTASKSVSILGAMERLEPMVSAVLTLGGFCMLALLCRTNHRIASALLPARTDAVAGLNFVLGGTMLWLSGALSSAFFAVGNTIFWGIIPMWILVVGARKKV